jgi:3D (Asp-Asp-Asp) domain-containing protein
VYIHIDGKVYKVFTKARNIYDLLNMQKIQVAPQDIIEPYPNQKIENEMNIVIKRVRETIETIEEKIPFPVKIIKTPKLHISECIYLQKGSPGKIIKKIKALYHDNKLIFEKVIEANILQKVKKEIKLVGTSKTKRMYMMKRPMKVVKTLLMKSTAYYPGPEDCAPYDDGYTYLGYKAGYGVCAVDPKTIPLGSKLYVEGYGYALAVDIGSAVKGKIIDLCFDTFEESRKYKPKWVKVHILK